MKKKIFGIVALASVFVLGACGGGGEKKDNSKGGEEQDSVSSFPIKTSNDKEAIKGGTLDVAVVTDSQFAGVFSDEFSQDNYDSTFMAPSHEGLFAVDKDFKLTDGGAANIKFDNDKKTATVTLRDNVKWSDGEQVTADDMIFSYEIIGHKDYPGVRYDDTMTNIVGMEDYHAGKADTISGIKKVDDLTMEITFKEMTPSMLQAGGGVWGSAAPKHVLKDIAVKDMESSDAIRKHPVTFGPFYMKNIQPGESVEFAPNEHYYGDKPKLDKVVFSSVPSASIVEGLKSKKYDMAFSMPTDNYPTYKDVEGYEMLGRTDLAYTYLAFKLGTWENGKVKTNPDAKMADKSLRQAMAYAIDNNAVGQKFYNGLRQAGTSLIIPSFGGVHDTKIKGYNLDVDKANKLLDDAGYKDTDGDGIREDKDGKKFSINYAGMEGGETAQPLSDYYIQQWKAIGLDVKYATGRLIEFNSFYDKLENDDPEIDVYQAAWSTGMDPTPTVWSSTSPFNYTRFQSEENDKLIKDIMSEKALDEDYQKEAFDKWQEYAFEEAFAIPTLYRDAVLPVSERVTGYDWSYDYPGNPWAEVGVTAEKR